MHVYTVEHEEAVFTRRMTPITTKQAREIATRLFEHFDVPPIGLTLKPRKRECTAADTRVYAYWLMPTKKEPLGRIRLLRACPDWIICHEVAHYVAWYKWCNGERHCDPSHNSVWAETYVEAVAIAIGPGYAKRLAKVLGV
jgi:hypothetical protein